MVTFGAIAIFVVIGTAAVLKKGRSKPSDQLVEQSVNQSVNKLQTASLPVNDFVRNDEPIPPPPPVRPPPPTPPPTPIASSLTEEEAASLKDSDIEDFPEADRIHQLFTTGPMKLPIVETITYASSVPWIKGRPAWVADYASHYATSRHFIARSLNGKPDYISQKVSNGSKFNVFKKDKNINFYILIDVSRCKMAFYYVDLDTQERVLLKTYKVALGRIDAQSSSGCLTPVGKYSLGSKTATYKPGVMGYFQGQTTEMIQVFGTRWIPFDQELEGTVTPAKGYGIHGVPWVPDSASGQLVEKRGCLGKYDGDGCIRLASEDMEELFAIVVTKPTYVVIVKDYHEAMLPGKEAAASARGGL